METNPSTVQFFSNSRLEWAKHQFANELRSGFQRSRSFDSFKSQRDICVLRDRSSAQLDILGRVLPLQVLSTAQMADERLQSLGLEEREAVEKLRDDYHRDYIRHFDQHIMDVARKDNKEARAEFNVATRIGNDFMKTMAARWNCESVGAAPGEWGLIFYRQDLRITVSLKLGRNMELEYSLSISDTSLAHTYCFHDHYLGTLGIGSSSWIVESATQFSDKLAKAMEFALWHKNEYDRIIDGISAPQKV